jgi:glutamate racemase
VGLELEMLSLKALLLGCLHYLHICHFFDPLLPQDMDIETLRRTSATVCLLLMLVGY